MNARILSLSVLLFIFSASFGQKAMEGSSNSLDLNVTKDPPVLFMVEGSLKFTDANGDNAIGANEKATISFDVINKGKGDASGLVARVQQTGSVSGLVFDKAAAKGGLAPGAKKTIEVPVSGSMALTTGTANFVIKLEEEAGFGLDDIQLDVKTQAFVAPQVKVPDYTITSDMGSTLTKKRPFDLEILVQNIGKGTAENVTVKLSIPDDVLCISDNIATSFAKLNSGETKTVVYSLIVNEKYASNSIPVEIKLSEHYGKYAENKSISLQLNQAMAGSKMVVESKVKEDNSIVKEASLSSDVDKNIPVNAGSNAHRYALIIGNEDYTKYQTNLGSESNVAFAVTDASIFAAYCEKTLGVQHENITFLENAISSKMKQEIEKISKLVQYENGNAEIIFYYAGHGFPDEATKESYIMPVDISGSNVTDGIKLSDLYQKLTENPVKRVSVFLDACFSGGGRDAGLLAARSVKIRPKTNAIDGNILVLSASSGEQSSLPYKDKQHGMFTYFLLKKLQETKGDVLYKDLFDYVKQQVQLNSIKVNGKDQNPDLRYGPAIDGTWAAWKVK